MKKNKNKPLLEPMGGIEIKYDQKIKDLTMGSTVLLFGSLREIAGWEKDGGVREHVGDWLNGPFRTLGKIESDFAAFVAEVMADPEFSDQSKEKFRRNFVDMVEESLERARRLDRYVMTGELSLDGCKAF